jgi:hypothetical protein
MKKRKMNEDEDDAKRTLELAGFLAGDFWSEGDEEYLFDTTTPEDRKIGPMNDREVFWMLEGYRAGKGLK